MDERGTEGWSLKVLGRVFVCILSRLLTALIHGHPVTGVWVPQAHGQWQRPLHGHSLGSSCGHASGE